MAREDLHFRLRIPEDLKQKIQDHAEVNRRSMTAEIIARLEASFQSVPAKELEKELLQGVYQREKIDELGKVIESLSKRIDRLIEGQNRFSPKSGKIQANEK